jgi:hypothetical protein
MAAGLGFKTFNTGDVLSAADVNGYLMQGILVFASATARDAAITSPEEGQFAFLKDTNVTTYYTGSAWANVDTTGMTNPMTTTGDVIYSSSGSTPARLGIGTAGQVLQVNSGATAPEWATVSGGFPAWTSYTPTVTAQSGSITTYSASGWYSQSGKTVVVQARVVISNAGTGSGTMIVTLPITAQTRANAEWVGAAVEGQSSGHSGWASVLSAATAVNVRSYNFGSFVNSNYITSFTVTYEVA